MFFKSSPQSGKYLLATTFATIRYDPLIDQEIGVLGTDNLQSCFCLIFVGVSGRISLTHTNFNIDINFLQEELRWIKEVKNIYLVKNCNPAGETIKELYPKYMALFITNFMKMLKANGIDGHKIEVLLSEHGIAAVDRGGKFIRLSLGTSCEVAPYKYLRETINVLNHIFEGENLGCDIQYQNGQWSACPELRTPAKNVIDHCRELIKTDLADQISNPQAQLILIADYLKKLIHDKNSVLKRRFDFQGDDMKSTQAQQFIAIETDQWSTKILGYLVLKDHAKGLRTENYVMRSVLTSDQLANRAVKEKQIEDELNKPAAECLRKKEEQQLREGLTYLHRAEESLKDSALEDLPCGAAVYSNFVSCYRDLYKLTSDPVLLTTAIRYCDKALAIRKQFYGKDSEQVAAINKKLEECNSLKSLISKMRS
jgi:hypothetical protein